MGPSDSQYNQQLGAIGNKMIRIYGIKEKLNPVKAQLSDIINQCIGEALAFPSNKRSHRFFPIDKEDYCYPEDRTDAYTVIEIAMMEGRSIEAKKQLIHLLFERIEDQVGISPVDVEITISEFPPCNWGFRGTTGDEANLKYKVNL
jgi:phenylpyruvate tautomerase PptA (4-oxalocrotonate tautomerase family)